MSSSLRNSLHRRNHKERSQLANRSRLGILEKHKDYVLRARDYHSKQDRIQRLRQKAAERNKDEFYFGMTRQKTEGGVHVQDRGNVSLPLDIVKVLKTQDENYLRTMRTAGLKKIDKIKNQLSELADLFKLGSLENEDDDEDELGEDEIEVLREAGVIATATKKGKRKYLGGRKPKHLVFVDDPEQAKQFATTKPAEEQHTPDVDMTSPEDLGWKVPQDTKANKRRRSKGSAEDIKFSSTAHIAERREAAKEHRTRLLKELSARLTRDRQLRYAERELEMQRLLMGKGASRKMSGVEEVKDGSEGDDDDDEDTRRPKKVDEKTWKPKVYKWRLERKR